MQLTYNQALDTIIEHTEMGYTIASQDRLWIVFIFDLDSDGEWAAFRYNRLYPMVGKDKAMHVVQGTSYDHDMDHDGAAVPVWTSRAEAEHFAMAWRHQLLNAYEGTGAEMPEVYVMNLGDDARYEHQIIGHKPSNTRAAPKFKGSEKAWAAMPQMYMRAAQWQAELEAAEAEDDEPSCP